MKNFRRSLLLAALAGLPACETVHWYPEYEDRAVEPSESAPTSEKQEVRHSVAGDLEAHATRMRIASLPLRLVLFPFNMLASGLSNFIMGGVMVAKTEFYIAIPAGSLAGLFVIGPCDAWHGYMFWEPTAADPIAWRCGFDY